MTAFRTRHPDEWKACPDPFGRSPKILGILHPSRLAGQAVPRIQDDGSSDVIAFL